MNELDMLRSLRAHVPAVDSHVRRDARARLEAAIETSEEARRTGRPSDFESSSVNWISAVRRHRRKPLTLLAGAVLALAAALSLFVLLPTGSPSGPGTSAAAVLNRAAQTASTQSDVGRPLQPGEFLYVKEVVGSQLGTDYIIGRPGSNGTSPPFSVTIKQQWIALNGSGDVLVTPQTSEAFPTVTTHGNGQPFGGLERYGPGGIIYPLPVPSSSDPLQLSRTIEQRYEGGHEDVGTTFQLAGTFLQETTSGALRRALYLMIEHLPGVRYLGAASDGLHRSGLAVYLDGGGVRNELIFDAKTSAVLEVEQRSLGSGLPSPTGPITPKRGALLSYTEFLTVSITRSAP